MLKINKNIFYFTLFLAIFFGCDRQTNINSVADNFPPAVPNGLNVYAAHDGEVGLEWQKNIDDDLKGYNIYRKTASSEFSKIAFTLDDFFIDDSLDYDTTYFYIIRAINNSNLESASSNEVSAKPVNLYRPSTPRFLNINARNWQGDISIYLNWQPNFETDINGYNIYRGTSSSFNIDSTSFVGFTNEANFIDTLNLLLGTDYFFKIVAIDKGELLSDASEVVSDKILEIPEMIFPKNNAEVKIFDNFIIKGIEFPANYKIIVQTNEFFDEFWSKSFFSSIVNDTINIKFDPPFVNAGQSYYWRVATFTNNNSEPNSVSKLFKFKIKP